MSGSSNVWVDKIYSIVELRKIVSLFKLKNPLAEITNWIGYFNNVLSRNVLGRVQLSLIMEKWVVKILIIVTWMCFQVADVQTKLCHEPKSARIMTVLETIYLNRIHSKQGWTATTRHGVTRKRSTENLKHTEILFRKSLELKGVC